MTEAEEHVEEWDAQRADALVGTTAIVTLTFVDTEGDELGADVFTCLVVDADEEAGIELEVFQPAAGERVVIAPLLDAFEPAEPGFYELEDEGLTIEDPDWFVSLRITVDRPSQQLGPGLVN